MTLPAALAAHPVLTGWLADPSVLAPGSVGIQIGSQVGLLCSAAAAALPSRLFHCTQLPTAPSCRPQVGYAPELALQGGTPAVMLPVLTFNHLMEVRSAGVVS